ncbi:MAG: transcriptional repressor LexA [Peptococcaceae bacterium]|nr:transcriptional repressor LexA [Peptococcaceae bacterium]
MTEQTNWEQEQAQRRRERGLTKRQRSVLEYIIESVEELGYPPAVREIGKHIGLSSSSTVHAHMNSLEKMGYIRRDPTKPRAITILLNPDGTPYERMRATATGDAPLEEMVNLPVVGNVAAGAPIFADENIEDTIPFSMRFVRNEGAFMLRIRGNSMVNIGIMDKDYIIVAPQQTAENGEVVVALIGDEATCKTFYHEKDAVRLQPENDEMEPIYVKNPMIIGKVIGVYRDMH